MTSDAIPPAGEEQKQPLGILATLAWAILVFLAAQAAGTVIVLVWLTGHAPSSLSSIDYNGPLVALVTLVTNPVIVALLAVVARLAGWDPAQYLGLVRFRADDFARGVIAIAVMVAAIDGY